MRLQSTCRLYFFRIKCMRCFRTSMISSIPSYRTIEFMWKYSIFWSQTSRASIKISATPTSQRCWKIWLNLIWYVSCLRSGRVTLKFASSQFDVHTKSCKTTWVEEDVSNGSFKTCYLLGVTIDRRDFYKLYHFKKI